MTLILPTRTISSVLTYPAFIQESRFSPGKDPEVEEREGSMFSGSISGKNCEIHEEEDVSMRKQTMEVVTGADLDHRNQSKEKDTSDDSPSLVHKTSMQPRSDKPVLADKHELGSKLDMERKCVGSVKRKLDSELDSDEENVENARPIKRISPFFNTPKQKKEEKRKILQISVEKLHQIDDPEQFLRRSVLINNTVRRLRKELKKDKTSTSYGYYLGKFDIDIPMDEREHGRAASVSSRRHSVNSPNNHAHKHFYNYQREMLSNSYLHPNVHESMMCDGDIIVSSESDDTLERRVNSLMELTACTAPKPDSCISDSKLDSRPVITDTTSLLNVDLNDAEQSNTGHINNSSILQNNENSMDYRQCESPKLDHMSKQNGTVVQMDTTSAKPVCDSLSIPKMDSHILCTAHHRTSSVSDSVVPMALLGKTSSHYTCPTKIPPSLQQRNTNSWNSDRDSNTYSMNLSHQCSGSNKDVCRSRSHHNQHISRNMCQDVNQRPQLPPVVCTSSTVFVSDIICDINDLSPMSNTGNSWDHSVIVDPVDSFSKSESPSHQPSHSNSTSGGHNSVNNTQMHNFSPMIPCPKSDFTNFDSMPSLSFTSCGMEYLDECCNITSEPERPLVGDMDTVFKNLISVLTSS